VFPDTGWAPSTGSFAVPVPAPITDPDAAPTKTVTINCDWLPYIRGALLQLVIQATWKTDIVDLTLTQMRAMTLISMFDECSGATPPFACPYDFVHVASGTPWFPFTNGDEGTPTAQFVPTVGWNSVNVFEPGGGNWWQEVSIAMNFPSPRSISIVTAQLTGVSLDFPSGDGGNGSGAVLWNGGSVVAVQFEPSASQATGDPVHNYDFAGQIGDKIHLKYLVGLSSSNPAGGLANIAFASVTGHDDDTSCP